MSHLCVCMHVGMYMSICLSIYQSSIYFDALNCDSSKPIIAQALSMGLLFYEADVDFHDF
jgi:hypothetical protein